MSDMIKKRKYKKPAIQEAIFEAKFAYDNFDSAIPGQIFERIKGSYPKKKNIESITVTFGNANTLQSSPSPVQTPVIQAWKEDDSELLQVGPGIAAANQLNYSNWGNFIPAIRAILSAYISIAEPLNITRVGIRYINNFLIPEENINFNDYFNIKAQIPSTLNNLQGFDLTFVNRLQSTSKAPMFEVRTKFTTALLKAGEVGNKFILDIDCYMESTIKPTPEINDLIALATQAHDTLGLVLESILTDKIRDLLEVEQ